MHNKSMMKKLLRLEETVIESISFEMGKTDEVLVVNARPKSRETNRCPKCNRRCPGYDSVEKLRRWRGLDLGVYKVYIESLAPRVKCKNHGILVAKVPWARHGSKHTRDFEETVTWFTLRATMQDVSEYFRIKWDTVDSMVRRVQQEIEHNSPSPFDNLEEIGIDETSYKKGHKYMTVIINHKTGDLIWAKKGHGKAILSAFFEELTEEQRANIKYVTADGARWIASCVEKYCPKAKRCIDPFHVVSWANESLDEVRKQTAREAKKQLVKKAAESAESKPSKKKKKTQKFENMLC